MLSSCSFSKAYKWWTAADVRLSCLQGVAVYGQPKPTKKRQEGLTADADPEKRGRREGKGRVYSNRAPVLEMLSQKPAEKWRHSGHSEAREATSKQRSARESTSSHPELEVSGSPFNRPPPPEPPAADLRGGVGRMWSEPSPQAAHIFCGTRKHSQNHFTRASRAEFFSACLRPLSATEQQQQQQQQFCNGNSSSDSDSGLRRPQHKARLFVISALSTDLWLRRPAHRHGRHRCVMRSLVQSTSKSHGGHQFAASINQSVAPRLEIGILIEKT